MIKYYITSVISSAILMFILNYGCKERINRFHDAAPLPKSAPKIVAVFKLCIVCFIPILRIVYIIGDILLITAPQAWADDWNEKIDIRRYNMCLKLGNSNVVRETTPEPTRIKEQLVEAVIENILAKRRLHHVKYHREPEFVKMPYFVAKEIARYYNKYLPINDTICDTLYGMKVCPSHSLTEYDDIEVF